MRAPDRSSSFQDRLLYPSIPIGFVDDVLHAARYRGLDVERLLRACGLSGHQLEMPGLRVSIEQYSRCSIGHSYSRLAETACGVSLFNFSEIG